MLLSIVLAFPARPSGDIMWGMTCISPDSALGAASPGTRAALDYENRGHELRIQAVLRAVALHRRRDPLDVAIREADGFMRPTTAATASASKARSAGLAAAASTVDPVSGSVEDEKQRRHDQEQELSSLSAALPRDHSLEGFTNRSTEIRRSFIERNCFGYSLNGDHCSRPATPRPGQP